MKTRTKTRNKTRSKTKTKTKIKAKGKGKGKEKQFLLEISKLLENSQLEKTQDNYETTVDFMENFELPFELSEKILTETDKYNKFKKIFESFNFENKLKCLNELQEVITKPNYKEYVDGYIDLKKLIKNIEEFEYNIKTFPKKNKEFNNSQELVNFINNQQELLEIIIQQIGELNGSIEEELNNTKDDKAKKIFDAIKKFYDAIYTIQNTSQNTRQNN